MSANSPLSYVGKSLEQVAFAVKDLEAGQRFFQEKMGIAKFFVIENFGKKATDKIYCGRPVEHDMRIALAYSGDTQIELIQHLSGETPYQDFIARRGEGMHHLGYFFRTPGQYESVREKLLGDGIEVLMSGRLGDGRYTYFDTEAMIGAAMELVDLGPNSQATMARIKRGAF